MNNLLSNIRQIIVSAVKKNILDLFRIIKAVPFFIFDTFIPSKNEVNTAKSLLIIKLDELGDYILFRNFLKAVRESKKYGNYKITIIGNEKWKELCSFYDSGNYDDLIWIDKNKFTNSFKYREKILSKIRELSFDTVVNPVSSRNFIIDDAIIRISKAAHRIGYYSDDANSPSILNFISNTFYNELYTLPSNYYFEFYRNRYFFEKLLEEKIYFDIPSIKINKVELNFADHNRTVIIAPGAGAKYRQWPIKNFAVICKYINEKYDYDIKLIGGSSEYSISSEIISQSKLNNIHNLSGKTSLVELVKEISESELVIANDSGIAHISGALGIKTIIISNGSRFGRFTPYPNELGLKVISIYPPSIMSNLENNFELLNKLFKFKSYLDINKVTPSLVMKYVDIFL